KAIAQPNSAADAMKARRGQGPSPVAKTSATPAKTRSADADTSFDPSIARYPAIPHDAYSIAGSATASKPIFSPASAMAATMSTPAQVSTRVMSPASHRGIAYHASSPGGYTKGEHGGMVLWRHVAYGLPPCRTIPMDSLVARSTSLPSRSGSRRRRSEIATRIARYDVDPAACREPRSVSQARTTADSRIATRSICGALTSVPSTAQKNATASAARTGALAADMRSFTVKLVMRP